jgi:O-antigen/teichoic acid export membrane protein
VILLLPTSVYGYIFTALGRQRLYMGCAVVALLTNIGLDLLLIPSYSYIGAAVGTLVAEAVLYLSGLMMLQRLGSTLVGMRVIGRPVLAGLALGLCCWWASDMGLAGLGAGIVSGLAAYAGVLLLLQTFTQRERALLLAAMRIRLGSVSQ